MIHATVKSLPLYIPPITVVPVALDSVSRTLLVPLALQFHSMKTFEKTNAVALGYMMLHCVAPQQSLIMANPALAMVGLLGGGSAFFSAGLPAMFKTGHH